MASVLQSGLDTPGARVPVRAGQALRTVRSLGFALALAAAGVSAVEAGPAVPAALRTSALMTARTATAGMLAVTRVGQRLVAVGERGIALLSDDDGQHWRQARVPVQATLTAVRFIDERNGFAVGHMGVVLRTEDAGLTWALLLDGVRTAALALQEAQASGDAAALQRAQQLVDDGPDKPFFDVVFRDAQHGWIIGAYNTVLRTEDGGRTWTSVQLRVPNRDGVHLYAAVADGHEIVLAGEQGFLARSVDGGEHFTALPTPYRGSFFGLLRGRDGALLAFGLKGNAWRTTDPHRQVWNPVDTGVSTSLSAGQVLPDGGVVLLTQTGDLLRSPDGVRFTRQAVSTPLPAVGLTVLPGGGAVVASLRGLQRQAMP